MEKEIDLQIIKATQSSLGKHVKRPPLSEKLLKKPPFRFLHDVVTSVLKTTGFFEGLFEEAELISDNVKDRESKILFLNKVITVLATTTGKSLSVKSSKIVAGQEAEKTNELLQCLAYALDNKLTSHDAVKKYKELSASQNINEKNDKPKDTTKSVRKVNEDKKLNSKSNDKLSSQKRETSNKNEINITVATKASKTAKPDIKHIKNKKESISKQSKLDSNKKVVEKTLHKGNSLEARESRNKIVLDKKDEALKQKISTVDSGEDLSVNSRDKNNKEKLQETSQESIEPNAQPNDSSVVDNSNDFESKLLSQSVKEEDKKMAIREFETTENNVEIVKNNIESESQNHEAVENRSSDKIHTSNDQENKRNQTEESNHDTDTLTSVKTEENIEVNLNIKDSYDDNNKPISLEKASNVTVPIRPNSVRPSSSRPGAPRLRDKHETVVGSNDNLIVGKVNIIQENTPIDEEDDNSIIIVESKTDEAQEQPISSSANQHGHLVQQILDSTKEFSQTTTGKTEIEWQFDSLKAREASSQEIEQVRFNIQALSRVANPLGKLLDHVQEDVEVMRQELEQWSKTYEDASKELLKQNTAKEESLLPLHTKIKQLDADIEEKHDKINDLKVKIHKNASRITKLLANGNVQ